MDREQRLDRFEQKLDAINESLISLARIEERVTTILKNNDSLAEQVKELDSRVDDLEGQTQVHHFTLAKGERLFWIGMTIFAGILATGAFNV
jgi:hypothetical protein